MSQHALEILDSVQTIRVMVCEDAEEQLSKMAEVVYEVAKRNKWDIIVEAYSEPQALLAEIKTRKKGNGISDGIDIVLADIRMPDMDGITLGRKLRCDLPNVYLIFTTAYAEYAIQGYETQAFRYLLKPVASDKLEQIMKDIFRIESENKSLLIKNTDGEHITALHDIIYLSAEDKYVIIHTAAQQWLSRISLQEYESVLLPYGFYRIHRKFLINMMHHKSLQNGKIFMSDGSILLISRRKEPSYRQQLYDMLEGRLIR